MCVFFSLSPRGTKRRVGKSYLEGVLKEIHVGINPDIIESVKQPSPLSVPPYAFPCTNYKAEGEKKVWR